MKKHSIKHLITIFALLFLLSFSVFAKESAVWDGTIADGFAGGTGSETDPYIIKTAEQLAYFSHSISSGITCYVDKYIRLENDIVLNDTSNPNWISNAKAFEPIGNSASIELTINNADEFDKAANTFGTLMYPKRDFYFNVYYSHTENFVEGVTTYYCTAAFYGVFDGAGHYVKGLYIPSKDSSIGLFGRSEGTIMNVGVIDSHIEGHSDVGSVVGTNYSQVLNCFSRDSYIFGNGNVGGIVGYSSSSIEICGCYNTSTVQARGVAGGITGNGHVINSYNAGTVTGTYDPVGGIAGFGNIKYCYNVGLVTGQGFTGAILGHCTDLRPEYCYYLEHSASDLIGSVDYYGVGGYFNNQAVGDTIDQTTVLNKEQMQTLASYSGFDFKVYWKMDTGEYLYPVLKVNNRVITPSDSNTEDEPSSPADDDDAPIFPNPFDDEYLSDSDEDDSPKKKHHYNDDDDDTGSIGPWIVIAAIALCIIVVIIVSRTKKKK